MWNIVWVIKFLTDVDIRLALFFLASLKNFKKYLVLISSKQISKNFVH